MTLRDLIDKIYIKDYEISLFTPAKDRDGTEWLGDIYIKDIAWIEKYMDCKVIKWSIHEFCRLTIMVTIEY